jgi:predicted nucleic acid-binding protein
MTSNGLSVIYWDSSAILATLLQDRHSEQALSLLGMSAVHVLSSLAVAEVHAVLNRLKRERAMPVTLVDASLEILCAGRWRRLRLDPDTAEIHRLAAKWPLRGADLWHLALATTLQRELPELVVLTFDKLLYQAAVGENFACAVRH